MAGSRGHEAIPHTADVGLRAWAPDLDALFEEASLGLSELAASLPADEPRTRLDWEHVELEAGDLVGLAFAWLNELIGLAEVRRGATMAIRDLHVEPREGPAQARLTALVGLEPFGADGPRPLRHVKAATYHRLAIEPKASGWTLTAYLDV